METKKISSVKDLAQYTEYALFAANATRLDIERLCAEAVANSFNSVCVNGSRVELAYTTLENSSVQVVALVGFPLGANDSDAKRYETEIAVDQGAHEIDFVMNIGRLKDGDRNYVLREMRDLVEAADERLVKVILETQLLTRDEIILACQLAVDSGVRFVTTATDGQTAQVKVEDVKLLCETLGEELKIKVVGGIRDLPTAAALVEAGAARIGVRAGEAQWLMVGS